MKKSTLIILALLALVLPWALQAQMPMLLNRGKGQLIGVPTSPPINQSSNSFIGYQANFFGDSVTLGFNPTPQQPNLTNRFSTVLCSNLSMTESNYGVGGSEIADAQADMITTNGYSISNSTLNVWLTGYNDVFWFGTNQAALTDNQEAVNSLAAWLAIPTSLRVSETNVLQGAVNPSTNSIYFPPGWSTLPNSLGGLAYSSQPNAALFFFSGSTLLIGTARLNSNSGSVVVTVGDYVNGNVLPTYATNTYSCVRTSPNTGPGAIGAGWGGRTYSPGLIIITNLTANRHYAFFTPQTTDFTFFGWYASYATNQLPTVVLAGALKIAGSNYMDVNLPAGYTNGSDMAANKYSMLLSNSAATLSGLGLNVKWVPMPVLNSNTDYFYDGIHPNPSGHQKIENALQMALTGTTGRSGKLTLTSSENPSFFGDSVSFTGTMPVDATGQLVFAVDGTLMATNTLANGQAVYTPAALAIGQHTVVATYSGDANYSANTNTLTQIVNAAMPSVSWTTPTAIAYGTALSALQLNATSSVTGTFTYTPVTGTVLNAGTNLLTAVFAPTDGTDYARTTNTVNLTVQTAALTVTADSTNRHSNTANPVFTGSITGIQNSDNITALYTTTATSNSPVGTYPIIPQLVDPNGRLVNYVVTTNYGILTVSNAPPVNRSICYFFGDSVTVGFNPTSQQPNLTNRFSTLLCSNLSMAEANYGVGGSQIADGQADAITANTYTISNSTLSVWLAGYNDVFWFGTNQAALTDNQEAVNSLAAWLGIPTSLRVSETNVLLGALNPWTNSIYFPPGWSSLPNTLGGLAYSTQPNAALFYFSGNTLLIGTARLNGNAGSVVVTVGDYVDGNILPTYATNTYSCYRTSPNTGPGPANSTFGYRSYSPGLIIITNLTANRHYAFFTPQSSADTFFGWYASFSTNLLPEVMLAGTLKIAGSNYLDANLPAGYFQGSDQAVNDYSQILSNSAATLSGVGLNVQWAPVPVLNSNTDYFFDGIHPNSNGHRKIALALQAALTGTSGSAGVTLTSSENPSFFGDPVSFTGTLPVDATGQLVFSVDGTLMATNALSNGQAVYTVPAFATGLHTVVATYSGDANYSASTNTLTQIVNAAVPSVSWTTPTAIAYGTAISALQLNATSSVAGTFSYTPTTGTVLNAGTNLLTAIFAPTDGTDYARTTNTVNLTVQTAALTVTADNTNRHSNTANPVFTGSITGIQNSDNITALYTTTATSNSPVGTYPIVPQLVDPNGRLVNYAVTTNYGTLTVSNGPAAASPICYFFGDSVTVGFNPTSQQPNLTNRFSTLLCTNLSLIESNAGVGGSEIADAQADAITANNYTVSNSTVSVWLAGYNDVFWFGTNQAALTDNQEAVNSLAAWLGIPTSLRVSETNVLQGALNPLTNSIYFPPGWSTLPNALGGLAYSTQPNAALFFFSGNTLLIGTARLSSGAGTTVVTVGDYVDGNILPTYATNTYSCIRTSPNTGPGPTGVTWGSRSYSPGLIIMTNLTANRHYAFFTPQSGADTFLGWYASFSTNLLPKVILTGALKIAGSNYLNANLPSTYLQGSDQAANAYSQMLSNSAATLSGVGLNVKWVPVPVLNSNTDYFFDGINPNASGHAKIESAIQAGF